MFKKVITTNSGLFARKDNTLGLTVFSPYTGLIFTCHPSNIKDIIKWLNCDSDSTISSIFTKALGPGWAIPIQDAEYPVNHLLPDSNNWRILRPEYPIVINWLISGNCALNCRYCYADDLMRGKCIEPTKKDIIKIANTILSFFPLVVVLTGGDPLMSPHLEIILELISGKTGIILDTSGYGLNKDQIQKLKRYNVFVRISLDSEIPKVNNFLRPLHHMSSSHLNPNSSQTALDVLCKLIDAQIPVSVQTVATKYNRSDLEYLGDKLFRLGVRAWRILLVAPFASNPNEYIFLKGTDNGQVRFDKYIRSQIQTRHEKGWNKGMGVQITHNRTPNSVVLVSPDGTFLTESNVAPGKVVLDEKYPKNPRLISIFKNVDMHAHVERYLGI
jgi:MoaA/NifB/PqqE/SkfB family radical SAM enzyme